MIIRFRLMTPRARGIAAALAVLALALPAVAALTMTAASGHHRSAALPRPSARLTASVVAQITPPNDENACMDSNSDGQVYVDSCNGGNSQNWNYVLTSQYDGPGAAAAASSWDGTLTEPATGFCLGSDGAGDVFTGSCNGAEYQNWTWNFDSEQFTNDQTGLCLQVEGPGAPGDPDSVNATSCNSSSTDGWDPYFTFGG